MLLLAPLLQPPPTPCCAAARRARRGGRRRGSSAASTSPRATWAWRCRCVCCLFFRTRPCCALHGWTHQCSTVTPVKHACTRRDITWTSLQQHTVHPQGCQCRASACSAPSPPQAYTDGLLDSAALHRVCIAAAADFRRVWARYGGRHAGRNLGKALKHLNTGAWPCVALCGMGSTTSSLGRVDGRTLGPGACNWLGRGPPSRKGCLLLSSHARQSCVRPATLSPARKL